MADINQQAIIEIEINGQKAKKELNNLTSYASALREQIVQASQAGDTKRVKQLETELRKTNNQIRTMQRNTVNINETLKNLSLATPKELQQTIKAINRELNSGRIQRGSEEWKGYTEALKQVKRELKAIQEEQNEAPESMISQIGSLTQKWWAVYDIARNTIDEISSYANQKVRDYASMEEAQAQVIKYTGMEREEVAKLNEEFKKFDTRTAREELNRLAGEAGKLNITAREEVAGYVDAANQINVALGEDLGEDATKDMAQLAMMFGEDDRLGLRGSMLATASAINTVGQSSTSSEPYLADFLSEMGSVGVQAKLSQANLLGYASVLNQNKVEASVASTAFQQLTMKMFQEPAKFAEIAGQSVGDFTALLKTDANKAMLSFLKGLSQFGDLTETAPVIKSLSLDGQKAAQTLTALAGNIAQIEEEQKKANQAYNEATSVTKEYNVQNNTVQAQLEKAQKRAHDLSVELGERLYPIMANGLHIQSNLTKVLITLIDFATKHKTAILTVVGAYLTWQTALKVQQGYMIAMNTITGIATTLRIQHAAATAMLSGNLTGCNKILTMFNARMVANATLQKACTAATYLWVAAKALLTGKIAMATTAMKAFTATLAVNPVTLFVSAIAGAVGGLVILNQRAREARSAQTALNKADDAATKVVDEHKRKIQELRDKIHDNTAEIDDRRRAIDKLKEILPEYQAEISKEGTVINENTAALKKQNLALEQQARLKKKAVIEEEIKKRQTENNRLRPQANKRIPGAPAVAQSMWIAMDNQAISDNEKAIATLRIELTQLNEEIRKYNENGLNDDSNGDDGNDDDGNDDNKGGKKTFTNDDAIREAAKHIEAQATMEQVKVAALYAKGEITYREYSDLLAEIDRRQIEQKLQLYSTDSLEYAQLQEQKLDMERQTLEKSRAECVADIDAQTAIEEIALRERYAQRQISEQALHEGLFQLELEALQQKKALHKTNTKEWADYALQIEQLEMEEKLRKQQEYLERIDALRKEYMKKSATELMADELKGLDELHTAGLISEEEYQKMLRAIRRKYLKEQLSEDSSGTDGSFGENDSALSRLKREKELIAKAEADGTLTHAEALNQRAQADAEYLKGLEEQMQQYYATIGGLMSAYNDYMSASCDLEVAQIEKKYDAEIEAAGANTAKGKKLEEQKQKEVAAIKTKYSKKQMKIEIAQALAQTAMAAINAYSSAAAIPVTGWIMAPIAAAAAVAAGMLQIAAIKKQHEAQQTGYYEGGFTGGTHYRRVAGEVHEGEFVANHLAVKNLQILPALRLIDQAQRNNTISSLTAADVSEALGYSPRSRGSATPTQGGTDFVTDAAAWTAVTATMERTTDTLDSLNRLMDDGLDCRVTLDGPQGLDRQQRKYEKLNSNAHR